MPNKTVAIYQQHDGTLARIGLFTYRGVGASAYAISQAFHMRYPHAREGGQLYLSYRLRLNGQWTDDSQRLPLDHPQKGYGDASSA